MSFFKNLFLFSAICFVLSGCSDSTSSNKGENEFCRYNIIQNELPVDREITICFAHSRNYYDIKALSITKEGVKVSDEKYSFTMYHNFPISFTDQIVEHYSINELANELGETIIYGENGSMTAMLFDSYTTQRMYSLILCNNGVFSRTDFDLRTVPISMQMDNDYIYVFAKEKPSNSNKALVVTQISVGDGSVEQFTVPLSAFGLETIDNSIHYDNIFIIDDVLYFSFYHFGEKASIAVCDLNTNKGTNLTINDIYCDGRLFVHEGKIGLMLMEKDQSATISWYNFDRNEMLITHEKSIPVQLPETPQKSYEMYLFGQNFYFIKDNLCGFLFAEEDLTCDMAYVEINAQTGDIVTFIELETKDDDYSSWNYLIRDDGQGYQRFSK